MCIKFDETLHRYTNEKGEELISVTQLLKKAEIAPNYEVVNSEVLNRASERGSLVHKEIENYCKEGIVGFTTELENFIKYIQLYELKPIANEIMVHNDIIAGTVDCILQDKNGHLILVDFKTTSTIHTDCVSWQESIYKYLWELKKEPISKLQVFHFTKTGELKVKDLPTKPTTKVEELIEWYRNEDKNPYNIRLLLTDNQIEVRDRAVAIIRQAKQQLAEAEAQLDLVKDCLVEAMKNNGLSSYSDEVISISIVNGSTRKIVDTTKLKTEYPDIYEKVSKETTTKESIRFTIKENEND